jgi:hypothetical protein
MSFDRSFALRAGPKERSRFQELRSGNSVRLPGAVIGELHFLFTQSLRDDSMAVRGVETEREAQRLCRFAGALFRPSTFGSRLSMTRLSIN